MSESERQAPLQRYIGLKMVDARPGPEPVKNMIERTGSAVGEPLAGYEIIYPDGYRSWSPADVFNDAYRGVIAATFSIALEGMKRGQVWARGGWNGKNMWVGIQQNRQLAQDLFVMQNVDQELVAWVASQTDLAADDWYQVG